MAFRRVARNSNLKIGETLYSKMLLDNKEMVQCKLIDYSYSTFKAKVEFKDAEGLVQTKTLSRLYFYRAIQSKVARVEQANSKVRAALEDLRAKNLQTTKEYATEQANRMIAKLKELDWNTLQITDHWERRRLGYFKAYKNDVQAGIESYVRRAEENMHKMFDAFIYKMDDKVGADVESAKLLMGEHVWDFSILSVTRPNGEVENWQTKTILNVSKYGLVFNQFPTRMVK